MGSASLCSSCPPWPVFRFVPVLAYRLRTIQIRTLAFSGIVGMRAFAWPTASREVREEASQPLAAELLAMSDESTNYGIVIVLLGLSACRRATRLFFTSWKRETR